MVEAGIKTMSDVEAFRRNHSRVKMVIGLTTCLLVYMGALLIALDSVYGIHIRLIMGGCAVFMLFTFANFLWKSYGNKALTVSIIFLILIGLLMYSVLSRAVSVTGAYETMIANQQVALKCVKINADLRGIWKWGVPRTASPVCNQEPESWELLPFGWKYNQLTDAKVSDGTFKFSARSRNGDLIECTEQGCFFVE